MLDAPQVGLALLIEKFLTVLLWSAASIGAAMLADYVITVELFHDYSVYTPIQTFVVASIVAVPITYVLVNGRFKLRKAFDDLAIARDAAINADLSKTLFFSNMSHELRTPLNAILGFSELLGLDAFAEKRMEYAHLINESGAQLLDLVNDLLDLSRIEAGKFDLQSEPVNLRELIAECSKTIEPRLRASKLKLGNSIDPNIPSVSGDRRAIRQILLNLMTNAIKFSQPGKSIEVFARLTPADELTFGVKDEGIGIAEVDQIRVFERFGQVRQEISTSEPGTGLGLPIVKGLAEAHGGRVTMESRVGQGTCVTVWLPLERLKLHNRLANAS